MYSRYCSIFNLNVELVELQKEEKEKWIGELNPELHGL